MSSRYNLGGCLLLAAFTKSHGCILKGCILNGCILKGFFSLTNEFEADNVQQR